MISKELLSKVLGIKFRRGEYATHIKYTSSNSIEWQELYIENNNWDTKSSHINIYELAHKCKKWAFNQGYEVVSRILSNDHQERGHCYLVRCEDSSEHVIAVFNTQIEYTAIFEACQWILENTIKENKC